MKLDTIYTYFSDYSEENVNKMLSFLTDKEMELVKIRFGNNLKEQLDSQNVPKKVNTSKFYNEFYKSLVPKMKKYS